MSAAPALISVRNTEPYPWPWDGDLRPARTALVVAGAQPGWVARSAEGERVVGVISRVALAVRRRGGTVVAVRHLGAAAAQRRAGPRPPLPPPAGSDDAARYEPVAAVADVVVDAAGIDGFYGGALDVELRRRDVSTLLLCGFGAEAAVDSTLRSANDRGYECLTLTDAVAPFDEATGRHALRSITMSGGIFGAIGPSDALLAALGETCDPAANPEGSPRP